MHGSWGNMIEAQEAFRAHGRGRHALAVLLAAVRPQPAVRLRAGARDPAQAADALELGQVPRRLRQHRGVAPDAGPILESGPSAELEPLDRWLVARTNALVAEATAGYESWLDVDVVRAFESFVDDVSNWYIRRSRRRFWDGDEAAFADALVRARPGAARRRAADAVPHGPPLARAHRSVRGRARVDPPRGLAGGRGARLRAARRGRGAPPRRRARPAGTLDRGRQAPPAAAGARRRRGAARRGPCGRDRGRAPGEGASRSARSRRASCA